MAPQIDRLRRQLPSRGLFRALARLRQADDMTQSGGILCQDAEYMDQEQQPGDAGSIPWLGNTKR